MSEKDAVEKVRFLEDCPNGVDKDGMDCEFAEGEVAELRPASAERWVRRGKAERVPPSTRVGKKKAKKKKSAKKDDSESLAENDDDGK